MNNVSSALQGSWNDYINAKVNAYLNSGGKSLGTTDDKGNVTGQSIWVGEDKYGQKHYSIDSQDKLNSILNDYNSGNKGYTTADGTEFTMYNTGTEKDPKWETMQTGLYQQKLAQDKAEADTQGYWADVDSKVGAVRDESNKLTNANFDASAKQYYSTYMQNQKKLAEQMSQMGMTGGVSETANMGVLNNYSSNLATNEGQRNQQLGQNQLNYAQQVADNSRALAQQLSQLAQQRQSEQTNYWNNATQQSYTRSNMIKQANIDRETYKKNLAAESKQKEKDTIREEKRIDKANSKALKDLKAKIKKGTKVDKATGKKIKPTYYIYYTASGKLKSTKSKSVALANNGIKYGSGTTLAELQSRKTNKLGYKYSNYYSKVYK